MKSQALKNILSHALFLIFVWVFFFFFFSVGSKNENFIFWFSSILSLITIISTYLFTYQLIPKYLITKKYRFFVLYSFYALVFIICAVLMTVVFGFVFFFNLEFQKMPDLTKNSAVILVCVLFILTLSSSIKILKYNYQSLEEKRSAENRILQMQLKLKEQELKFLRMQIHPHFLFNTLNTLYGFSLKKSDETPNMILKLSSLLDYILYQVDKPKVFLKNEINHIKDYISLEKSRFQESLNVNFSIKYLDSKIEIPPMLLLPFVENAFKHGVQIEGILNVNIRTEVLNNFLIFEIENSANNSLKSKAGIGLKNIKKRLEIIYNKEFELKLKETEGLFSVKLKVPINNEE